MTALSKSFREILLKREKASIHVETLGNFCTYRDGEKISAKTWGRDKTIQLFQYLITIGSPVWGIKKMKTPVIKSLEFLRGKRLRERNEKIIQELEQIPDVPITCIYTKTDGLVPWKHCLEAETYRSDIKNIEVFGSHCGLGANVGVLYTITDALNHHIPEKEKSSIFDKATTLLYPKFWNQKGMGKFTNLLFD